MRTLRDVFKIIGDQLGLSAKDFDVLRQLAFTFLPQDLHDGEIADGFTFLLALQKAGRCDDSNFFHIIRLLKSLKRPDLIKYASRNENTIVENDPLEEHFESMHAEKFGVYCSNCDAASRKRRKRSPWSHRKRRKTSDGSSVSDSTEERVTCDIRLRVRAECSQHESALQGAIVSQKEHLLERQFEKFDQANTILKSRDLGSIVCDIKFSELTYLDAFWRDYINGSLLEALKGVFITESLKQAVGQEDIQLWVNVDEDDYESGRRKLLPNLRNIHKCNNMTSPSKNSHN
ncbi:death effector domain-containing protein-like [Tubulanus polymorphus]|uniref:death effector domain-containing protein-like n=1 Tax=Tubulanus polymorphus TaxID=672921 RepID=UPI003DA202B3